MWLWWNCCLWKQEKRDNTGVKSRLFLSAAPKLIKIIISNSAYHKRNSVTCCIFLGLCLPYWMSDILKNELIKQRKIFRFKRRQTYLNKNTYQIPKIRSENVWIPERFKLHKSPENWIHSEFGTCCIFWVLCCWTFEWESR